MTTRLFIARADNTPLPVEVEHAGRVLLSPVIQRAPEVRHRVGPWHFLIVAICLVSAAFSAWAFAGCRKPVDATVRYEVDNPDEHKREEKRRQRGHTDIFEVTP